MRLSRILGVTFLTLIFAGAARADQVDNPRFLAWQKFAVGSTVTLSGEANAGQNKLTMEMTRTLVEKADDHVTVEIAMTVNINGQDRQAPAQRETLAAKADKQDITQDADEQVEAAGKTFDCKVFEIPNINPNSQDSSAKAKVWLSNDIPGGLVKMTASSQRGTVTYLLKDYQAK